MQLKQLKTNRGRHPEKKAVFFQVLPKLARPSPQFRQLGPLFFGPQKQCFAHMTDKSTDDDGCNDCYRHDGNFDNNDDKLTKKHTNISTLRKG